MTASQEVCRPRKKTEYAIVFASRNAERGWRDLIASQRNSLAEAWDFLTKTPTLHCPQNYRLKGRLSEVCRDGVRHARWQYKPTVKGSARIWFYVEGQTVFLEEVHTSHPTQTK